MIDRKRFNENFSYLDKEVVVEIIDIFLDEYVKRFIDLMKNIDDQDFDKLRFNAHSLKGVVANFMDPVTIELSKTLDDKAKDKDSTGLQELYDELKKDSEFLAEELRELKTEFTS
ncbi:MAG: Hpt domain-containing protein [Bacteroidia bacterium]|nr:Hpt domain-containing protein [Bacteroidia bacterium]